MELVTVKIVNLSKYVKVLSTLGLLCDVFLFVSYRLRLIDIFSARRSVLSWEDF